MKTHMAKPETIRRDWYVVDAAGRTLGRLASALAYRLRGKHKPSFTPHADTGDYIVVVNAAKIRVTGRKLKDKIYYHHSGYIGNMRAEPLEKLLVRAPTRALELAVKGMLPRSPLGRRMLRKLKVVAGPQHPHTAQQPIALEL
jgi:large subunit ribosomal protein L13